MKRLLIVYGVPAAALIALVNTSAQSAIGRGYVAAGVAGAVIWLLVAARLVK